LRAIFGLGNPEKRYYDTRHNIGFKILDLFLEKNRLSLSPGKGNYYFVKGEFSDSPFLIVKPVTYMNLSGKAVKEVLDNYPLEVSDLLIISDDINLDSGKIRIRQSGGDGGHNGIKSIIHSLETDQFSRLRFGVGKEFDNGLQADYVLSKFDDETLASIKPSLELSVLLIEEFLLGGTQSMLNLLSKSSQKDNSKTNSQNEDN